MMRRPDPITALLWLVLILCALCGLALAAVIGPDALGKPEPLPGNMIRCWGWYEGTDQGMRGEPCPPDWPLSDRYPTSPNRVRVSTHR
jgi:hypothetical protein